MAGAETTQNLLKNSGDSFSVTFPNKAYLIIVTNMEQQAGDYDFTFRFTDKDGEAIAKQKREEEAAAAADDTSSTAAETTADTTGQ